MNQLTRSARLPRGRRRISLNINIDPELLRELGRIARGNRSAAVEELVRRHIATRTRIPEPI